MRSRKFIDGLDVLKILQNHSTRVMIGNKEKNFIPDEDFFIVAEHVRNLCNKIIDERFKEIVDELE